MARMARLAASPVPLLRASTYRNVPASSLDLRDVLLKTQFLSRSLYTRPDLRFTPAGTVATGTRLPRVDRQRRRLCALGQGQRTQRVARPIEK